jgi:ABC-type tungstate transport system substrate-binding protein
MKSASPVGRNGLEASMNTTIGAIVLGGVFLAAPVVISIVAVTINQTGSPQADVTARDQLRHEHVTSLWGEDYYGGRVHPPAGR